MIAILSTMLTKDLTMRKGIGSHEVMKARSPSSVTQDRHRVAIAPKVLCINELIVINSIFNLTTNMTSSSVVILIIILILLII